MYIYNTANEIYSYKDHSRTFRDMKKDFFERIDDYLESLYERIQDLEFENENLSNHLKLDSDLWKDYMYSKNVFK